MVFKWREDHTVMVLEMLKNEECLWNTKSPFYRNKNVRDKALESMAKRLNLQGVTSEDIKLKIKSIRTRYSSELGKVLISERSGAGPDEVYKPKLFWFPQADIFLRRVCNPRPVLSTKMKSVMVIVPLHYSKSARENTDVTNRTQSLDLAVTLGIAHDSRTKPPSLPQASLGSFATMDIRLWSKELTTDFINLYKSFPCLWKVRSEEYKSRSLRDFAYNQIAEFCKLRGFPEANREFVVRKIQSLRGSFRKEHKKYCLSPKKYIPSLWYYDLLLFTKDQELPMDCASDSEEVENHHADNFIKNDDSFADPCISSNVKLEPSINENVFVPEMKLTRKRAFLGEPVEMCSTTLGTKTEGISEFDAVGINVSKKLAKMDTMQAVYAESLISVILRKGLLDQLTEETNISKYGCS